MVKYSRISGKTILLWLRHPHFACLFVEHELETKRRNVTRVGVIRVLSRECCGVQTVLRLLAYEAYIRLDMRIGQNDLVLQQQSENLARCEDFQAMGRCVADQTALSERAACRVLPGKIAKVFFVYGHLDRVWRAQQNYLICRDKTLDRFNEVLFCAVQCGRPDSIGAHFGFGGRRQTRPRVIVAFDVPRFDAGGFRVRLFGASRVSPEHAPCLAAKQKNAGGLSVLPSCSACCATATASIAICRAAIAARGTKKIDLMR
jgi:hypothetical protein